MTMNLQTIKIHSLKAHLDRMQDTAEAMAQLVAGEVLAGRLQASQDLARQVAGILSIRSSIEALAAGIRGREE